MTVITAVRRGGLYITVLTSDPHTRHPHGTHRRCDARTGRIVAATLARAHQG
ncbi:MAG TPA: hypothetical protein VIK11_04730 [Tepidiformaceae bacterium]